MNKKILSVGVGLLMAFSPLLVSAASVSPTDNAALILTLTTLVQLLTKQLQQLLAAKAASLGHAPVPSSTAAATTTLPSTAATSSAIIDQSAISMQAVTSGSTYAITGSATSTSYLYIAMVAASYPTASTTLATFSQGAVVGVATHALVSAGRWSAKLPAIATAGSYKVLVFDNASGDLLASAPVEVTAPITLAPAATIDTSALMTTLAQPIITGTATIPQVHITVVGDVPYQAPLIFSGFAPTDSAGVWSYATALGTSYGKLYEGTSTVTIANPADGSVLTTGTLTYTPAE